MLPRIQAYAPTWLQVDLANYGPVTIQFVDPSGGAAYKTALNQSVDASGPRSASSWLTPGRYRGATGELAAGDADPRLMLIIKALAPLERVDVIELY